MGNHNMSFAVIPHVPAFTLSICISTRNRATFIGTTLESIIAQATSECEIVVFDGASTDDTEQIVEIYAHRFNNLRYFKQEVNDGLDHGFDHAVELASGEYCWLMPDDDLLKPGALAAILVALRRGYSLVVVNVEYREFGLSSVLEYDELRVDVDSDCEFGPEAIDELFEKCWRLIRYSGAIVIRREVWLARQKEPFYGSFWMDVAVVFQERLPCGAFLIATPYVSVRMGNQSWLSSWFEIFFVNWPKVVSALAISEAVKKKACADEPWESAFFLMLGRAAGQYSLNEYRRHIRPRLRSLHKRLSSAFIAVLPGMILNAIFLFYYSTFSTRDRRSMLLLLTQSRFNARRRWRTLLGVERTSGAV